MWLFHRYQIMKEKKVCEQRKWNFIWTEWLSLPFGRAGTDTVNLAELWRVKGIMAFSWERERKNDSERKSERLRSRVRRSYPSQLCVINFDRLFCFHYR